MSYLQRWLYYLHWRQKHKALLSAGFQGDYGKIRREIKAQIAHGPQWSWVSYIYRLVRDYKPKTVLEIGVQRGCSTFSILKGLHDNKLGELHSIDMVPDVFFQRLVAPVVPGGLKARWHYHEGDSATVLPKVLQEVGTVDMAFHDAVHEPSVQFREIQAIWDAGAKVIIVDYTDDNLADYSARITPKPSRTAYDYEHDGAYPIGAMFR